MSFRVVIALFALLVLLGGCDAKQEEMGSSDDRGSVTVTRDEAGDVAAVTVDDEQQKVTWSSATAQVSEALGVSVFPGATAAQGGVLQVAAAKGGAADAVVAVSLHSDEAIEKISRYYRNELQSRQVRIFEMAMPTGKMVTMTTQEDGMVTTVVLSESTGQDGTDIQISRVRE